MSFFKKLFSQSDKKDDNHEREQEEHSPASPPGIMQSPRTSSSTGAKAYPPGTRIAGRYEVASRPMMGGIGIIHICHDCGEDRPVVLETFNLEYLPGQAARNCFLHKGTYKVDLFARTAQDYFLSRESSGSIPTSTFL